MATSNHKPDLVVGGVPVTDEGGTPCLDLRDLQPPQPAVTILTFLAKPEAGDAVVVRLARDPIFLYPELAALGWDWELLHAEPQDVRLRLVRRRGGARP